MRLARVERNGRIGIVGEVDGIVRGLADGVPDTIDALIANAGAMAAIAPTLAAAPEQDVMALTFLPPITRPPKIICLGLNYGDHAAEGGFEAPPYPTIFARFAASLIGHGAPILVPTVSDKLDYEGELVAVIGKGGRTIANGEALAHIAGYSVFNDGSIRDYQMKTPQWTVGKNFDDTGAFGPWFVTPDELPEGAAGLKIETRLNGEVVQSANTSQMIFDVATTVSLLSECMTLETGDVLVMGTPSGVGAARKPPLFMKPGDVCEVEIERVGLLRNPIANA